MFALKIVLMTDAGSKQLYICGVGLHTTNIILHGYSYFVFLFSV